MLLLLFADESFGAAVSLGLLEADVLDALLSRLGETCRGTIGLGWGIAVAG